MKQRTKYLINNSLFTFGTTLLPTTASLICTQNTAKTGIKSILPNEQFSFIYDPFWQCVIIIVVCVILPILTTWILKGWITDKHEKEALTYNLLLTYLQQSVDLKRKRFFKEIGKHTTPSAVFFNITQPEEQIDSLCSGLCNSFATIYGINDIKATVIGCKDSKLNEYIVVCGDDEPSTSIEKLAKEKESLAKYCLEHKSMTIAENALKYKHFYRSIGCNIESAICFPILKGDKVAMIVCLTSKHKKTFLNCKRNEYRTIFDYFSSRIVLESYLQELKDYTIKSNKK